MPEFKPVVGYNTRVGCSTCSCCWAGQRGAWKHSPAGRVLCLPGWSSPDFWPAPDPDLDPDLPDEAAAPASLRGGSVCGGSSDRGVHTEAAVHGSSLFLSPFAGGGEGSRWSDPMCPRLDAALLWASLGAPELCPVGSAGRDGAPHSEKSTPWPQDNPTEASLPLPRRGAGFLRTRPPGVEGPRTRLCQCSRTFHQKAPWGG